MASGDQEACRQLVGALLKQKFKLRGRVVDRALRKLPTASDGVEQRDPDATGWTRAVEIVRQQVTASASDGDGTGRSTAADRGDAAGRSRP